MADIDLKPFTPSHPSFGSSVKAKLLRDQIGSLSTFNNSSTEPSLFAVIIGDRRFAVINLSQKNQIFLSVDGVGPLSVNLGSAAANVLAVTPTEIVAAINTAFSAVVAYTYDTNSADSSAYIAIKSGSTGTGSTVTINKGTGSADALDHVFGITSRGVALPYTITGVALPQGYPWYSTGSGDNDKLQMYLNSPAAVVGRVNFVTPVNLSVKRYLRIKITISQGVFGPLDIDVAGSSPGATSAFEVVTKINTAFTTQPGWPAGSGPASAVTREGAGSYIQLVSGNANAPQTGPSVEIKLSEVPAFTTQYLLDDAITEVFGLSKGEDGRNYNRLPATFSGTTFARNLIRGINDRSGAGIGPWGKAMDTKFNLPTTGVVDGEIRVAKDTGILWIYREVDFLNPGLWRRVVPAALYPLDYHRDHERWEMRSIDEVYNPEGVPPIVAGRNRHIDAGATVPGTAMTVVDARDSAWPRVSYPAGPGETSGTAGARQLHLDSNANDYLDDRVSTGTISPSTLQGGKWTHTQAITLSTAAGATCTIANNTATDAFYHRTAGYQQFVATTTGTLTYTIALDNLDGATILPGTFHLQVIDGITPGTVFPFEAFDDNGVGVTVNLVGTGVSSGTLNRSTGAISVTFSSAPHGTNRQIAMSYATSSTLVVCCQVKKDNDVQHGNIAEAGLIYSASHTASGTIDTTSGYKVVVRDNGSGAFQELRGDSSVPHTIANFTVDPPLDTTFRTLRVVFAGGNHFIYWNGSEKSDDWFGKEATVGSGLSLSSSITAGGAEGLHRAQELNRTFIAVYSEPGLFNAGKAIVGFTGTSASATGSFPQKLVSIRHLQVRGGTLAPLTGYPGLPPVSAIRTRDSIHSVGMNLRSTGVQSGIITDCNHATPLQFFITGDLDTSGVGNSTVALPALTGLDAINRKVNLGFDLAIRLGKGPVSWINKLLWDPTNNPNGVVAYYSLTDSYSLTRGGRYGLILPIAERSAFGTGTIRDWPNNGGLVQAKGGASLAGLSTATGFVAGWGQLPPQTIFNDWKFNWNMQVLEWETTTGAFSSSEEVLPSPSYGPGIVGLQQGTDGTYSTWGVRLASSGPMRPKTINVTCLAFKVT